MSSSSDVDERTLREIYFPGFETPVKRAKPWTVMCSYNRINGVYASENRWLLTDVLRNKWGFRGHIVSDCGAVKDIWNGHKIVKTPAEACAIAIKAGLNIECGSTFKALEDALKQGLVTEADIDNALVPLMLTRLKLGIIHPDPACPYNNVDPSVIGSPEHIALALQAATESMVLLKNNGALPIDKNIHTLYVTGAGAADAFWLMGNYFGLSDRYSTYLQGIVGKVSAGTAVNDRPGVLENSPALNKTNWAVGDATGAEKTIIVMGNNGNLEGEEGEAIDSECGDRKDLRIPESQMNFLRKICAKKKKGVIVVLTGGSPMDIREVCDLVDAVVLAWYPGQEGGYALANLLFGDANFSGRLPVTFPADGDKLPAFDDYSMKGRSYKYMTDNIYFPFGYGLSYGRVDYQNLQVKGNKKQGVQLTVTLSNPSDWTVTETVQTYVSAPGAGTTAPLQQLAAFQRVTLAPHQRQDVTFQLSPDCLMTVGDDGKSRLLKGEYVITVAGAAPGTRTTALAVPTLSARLKL
jgi:beta-glucosidase